MRIFQRFWRGLIVAFGLLLMTLSTAVAQSASPQLAPSDQSVLHLSETAQRDMPCDRLRAKFCAARVETA
jgi:hypothetical protein